MVGLGSLAAVALAHLVAGAGLATVSLKLYERGVLLGLTSGVVAVASVVAADWLIGTGLLRVTVREMQQLAAVSGLMAAAGAVSVLLLFEAEPERHGSQNNGTGSGGGSGEAADDPLEDVFDL